MKGDFFLIFMYFVSSVVLVDARSYISIGNIVVIDIRCYAYNTGTNGRKGTIIWVNGTTSSLRILLREETSDNRLIQQKL